MKKIAFTILTSILTIVSFAQVSTSTTIEEVTVFRNNAEITAAASTKIPAGTSEIILKDISTSINSASLQVKIAGGNVTLLSATYETNYLDANEATPEVKALQDELEILNEELRWEQEQKQIYYDLEQALNANIKLGGANVGYSASDLDIFLTTYKERQYEYNKAYLQHQKEETEINKEIQKISAQLNEENAKLYQPSGQIKLLVSAVSPSSTNFECTYLVSNAGWYPSYDIRSEGIDKDVKLSYKANIYQNTGYDWSRVDMTISTGNPSGNNERPILSPLYADFYYPGYNNGYYYEDVEMKKEKNAVYNMAYAGVPELEEVVLASGDYSVERDDYKDGFQYNATVAQNQLNVEFEIQLPQSIPSDSKYHLVAMDNYDLNSEYTYHAVPKLDKNAFLLAKISDWGQYNLLEGKANIFFEGAYIGETYINPNVTADTLLVSMGRDESIIVERVKLQDYTSSKLIGGNKKETFGYEIEIRNNKNQAIQVEILDQVPISNQKDIVVEVEEISNAAFLEDIGKLEWNLTISANQTMKKKLVYTVKYPKDQTVTGLE